MNGMGFNDNKNSQGDERKYDHHSAIINKYGQQEGRSEGRQSGQEPASHNSQHPGDPVYGTFTAPGPV